MVRKKGEGGVRLCQFPLPTGQCQFGDRQRPIIAGAPPPRVSPNQDS